MSDTTLRRVGIIVMIAGFALWAYGFTFSSFWYVNTNVSILEPVRVWLSGIAGRMLSPGVIEEIVGLTAALAGILLQVRSYYGRR